MSLPETSAVPGVNLEARLASLLDFVGESAKDATSFAVEQAPLVAREIVSWHIAAHSIGALIALGVVVGLAFLAWQIVRHAKQKSPVEREGMRFFAAFLLVLATAALIFALVNAGLAIKGVVAPRLVIIDEIRSIGGRR